MPFIADLHIHSKYSRTTSKSLDLESLDKCAQIKGIQVVGTGDFTHPAWLTHLKDNLTEEDGLFRYGKTKFLLTSEISCIYSEGGKVRKIHIIVLAPSFEVVDKINSELDKIGNLKSDGRPILGLSAKKLAEIILNISKECLIIPAHCMTPWFGLYGSKSGFDSLEECFGDLSKEIYAVETGLSADPKMLWQIKDLDNIALISNSDAHSAEKLGREANVFDVELSYKGISKAIKEKNLLYTIEFFPEEGKYHYDGHRNCDLSLSPEQTKKYNNICPNCGKPLTVGVLSRVKELAGRKSGEKPKGAIPFKSLVPLAEIIASCFNMGSSTKTVKKEYDKLIENFENEFEILLNTTYDNLKEVVSPEIAEGIIRVREGKIELEPGYDGVFGRINIFSKSERKNFIKQKTLF